jgi:hypothetical protein
MQGFWSKVMPSVVGNYVLFEKQYHVPLGTGKEKVHNYGTLYNHETRIVYHKQGFIRPTKAGKIYFIIY